MPACGFWRPAANTAASAVESGDNYPLTKRERQIAALMAQGLTNKQVAANLMIATRTAEGHVEPILGKLGLTSRAQIVTWIAEHPDYAN